MAAGDKDVCSLLDEPLCCRQADAGGAASDQRDLTVQLATVLVARSHINPPPRRRMTELSEANEAAADGMLLMCGLLQHRATCWTLIATEQARPHECSIDRTIYRRGRAARQSVRRG